MATLSRFLNPFNQSGSLSNRGPMGPQSGPLSLRGPQPTGRGMTPERRMQIAERQAVSRGDAAGAAQWASRAQWAGQFMPQQPARVQPPPVPQAPQPPLTPSGRLVSGRSAGSMVWQPNEVPVMDVPEMEQPVMPMRRGGESAQSSVLSPQSPALEMPMMPMSGPLDNDRNILGPLTGPQPRYTVTEAGGMNILEGPGGKYLNAFRAPAPAPQAGWANVPNTNQIISTFGGQRNPDMPIYEVNPQQNKGWSVTGQPEVSAKVTPVGGKPQKPNVSWQDGVPYDISVDERGNTQVRKLKIIDENGDGVDDRQQQGGQAAPMPSISGQTPGGVTFRLKDAPAAPATATGQVPTANHSAPLLDSPSASLSDANATYRNSGYQDDTALRQHFAKYPSAAVQAYTQQQQQDMAAQDTRRAAQAQEDALSQAAEAGRRSRVGILPTMVEGIKRGVPELIGDVRRAAPVVGAAIRENAKQTAKSVNLPAAADALLGDKRKTKAELEYEQFLEWKAKNKK